MGRDKRKCPICDSAIPRTREKYPATKYCSEECSKVAQTRRYRELNPEPNLERNTRGAISEHRVIVDLLSRGFEVFKAVSGASSCDLAILQNGNLYRVEVKTGHYGKIGVPYTASPKKLKKIKADILATVLYDKILYSPSFDSLGKIPA